MSMWLTVTHCHQAACLCTNTYTACICLLFIHVTAAVYDNTVVLELDTVVQDHSHYMIHHNTDWFKKYL